MGAVFLVLWQTITILLKKLLCEKLSVIIKQNIGAAEPRLHRDNATFPLRYPLQNELPPDRTQFLLSNITIDHKGADKPTAVHADHISI